MARPPIAPFRPGQRVILDLGSVGAGGWVYPLRVTRFLLPSAILLLMTLVWWIQMCRARRRLEELEREHERVHAELEEALARERLELWPPPNVIRLARWRKDLDRMHREEREMHREEQDRPPT